MFKPSKIFFYSAVITLFFASAIGGTASAKTINLLATSTDILYLQGSVGIGTATPSYSLQVSGPGTPTVNITGASGQLYVNNIAPNTGTTISFGSSAITTSGTITGGTVSGSYSGTISAANTSAGAFGSNTGGGNYTFPGNISLGTGVSGQTATPSKIDLGVNYSNGATRDKLKIYLYNTGTEQYGFGVGNAGDVQYHSNGMHDFYIANSPMVRINSTGVGIGTTGPTDKLMVMGGGIVARGDDATAVSTFLNSTKMRLWANHWTGAASIAREMYLQLITNSATDLDHRLSVFSDAGSPLVSITNAGNVGIGTTGPANKLHVVGDAQITTDLTVGDQLIVSGTGPHAFGGAVASNSFLELKGSFSPSGGAYDAGFLVNTDATLGVNRTYVQTNLGYGADNAASTVTLFGSGTHPQIITANVSALTLSGAAAVTDAVTLMITGTHNIGTNKYYLGVTSSAGGAPSVFNINSSGNVGIGTTNPGAKLQINSGTNTYSADEFINTSAWGLIVSDGTRHGGFGVHGGGGTTNFVVGTRSNDDLMLMTNDTKQVTIKASGNVGIGTTGPGYLLTIQGATANLDPAQSSQAVNLLIQSSESMAIDKGGSIGLGGTLTGTVRIPFGIIAARKENATDDNRAGYLSFHTAKETVGAYMNEWMRITSTGNVGIGTTNPTSTLTVAGAVKSTTGGFIFPDATTQSTAYLGGTQTIVAGNVSAGAFGSNTGNGNYSFPGTLAVTGALSAGATTITTTAGTGLLLVNNESAIGTGGKIRFDGIHSPSLTQYTGPSIAAMKETAQYQTALVFNTVDNAGGISERVRINGNGNVGIGTTGPGVKLDVFTNGANTTIGSVTGAESVRLRNDNATVGNLMVLDLQSEKGIAGRNVQVFSQSGAMGFALGYAEKMRIDSAGNVGIGTTGPLAPLHILSSAAASVSGQVGLIVSAASAGGTVGSGPYIRFDNGSGNVEINRIGSVSESAGNVGLAFSTLSANIFGERVRIQANGNVGIGTTAPGYKLDVSGDTIALQNTAAAGTATLRLLSTGTSGTNGVAQIIASNSGTDLATALAFQTRETGGSVTEKMRITGAGNVGIGTTGPGYKLDVQGGDINTSGVYRQGGTDIRQTCNWVGGKAVGDSAGFWAVTIYCTNGFITGMTNLY